MATFISSHQSEYLSDKKLSSNQQVLPKRLGCAQGAGRPVVSLVLLFLLLVSLAGNYFYMHDNQALQQAHNQEILRADSLLSAKLHVEKQLRIVQYGSFRHTYNLNNSLLNQPR